MQLRLTIFLLILCLTSNAQSISLSAGWNRNNLFPDGPYNFRRTEIGLKGGEGWSVNLNIHPNSGKQSLSIVVDNYQGQVVPKDKYNQDVPDIICFEKTTLGLGLYPYDFRLLGDLFIQPGAEISILVSDVTKFGIKEPGSSVMTYYNDSIQIASDFQFGVSVTARYKFNIRNFFIAPSYRFYIGCCSELGENADLLYSRFGKVFSLRHTLSLGVGFKFTKKEEESVYD